MEENWGGRMILDKRDCQKIVDRVISILGKNINIINSEGIIIASGDKSRINAFHAGAKLAVLERKEVIVEDNNLNLYKNCKKGVNLPIYYNGEILGVVGISGEPSEVKGYGVIVKELVELMIQENERRKLELFEFRAVSSFAKDLIKANVQEDESDFIARANLIGFQYNLPRKVIVVDICSSPRISDQTNENTETMLQRLNQDILDLIKEISEVNDIVFNLYEQRFVIFKTCKNDLKQYCDEIQKLLEQKLKINIYIGIGGVCKNLKDYHKAYMEADKVIAVGKKLDEKKKLYFAEDYSIQLLLNSISADQKQVFLNRFGDMFTNGTRGNINEMINTIRVYFENKMNVKDAATVMFLHRNTMAYRINKFKETYKIDITDPYECMLLYIASIMLELE